MPPGQDMGRSNFEFLAEDSPLLAGLGQTAERLYPFDTASCVLKLRLLAEALTQDIAARLGLKRPQYLRGEQMPQDPPDEPASELLKRLAASRADQPTKARGRRKAGAAA